MSASAAKSRFTCTVQVRVIMSRPSAADRRHVAAHDGVAALGHPRHLVAAQRRVEAERREADAERLGDPRAPAAKCASISAAGLVQRGQQSAGQLQLPGRLQRHRGGALASARSGCRGPGSAPSRRPPPCPPARRGCRRGCVRAARRSRHQPEAELLVFGADGEPRRAACSRRRDTRPADATDVIGVASASPGLDMRGSVSSWRQRRESAAPAAGGRLQQRQPDDRSRLGPQDAGAEAGRHNKGMPAQKVKLRGGETALRPDQQRRRARRRRRTGGAPLRSSAATSARAGRPVGQQRRQPHRRGDARHASAARTARPPRWRSPPAGRG